MFAIPGPIIKYKYPISANSVVMFSIPNILIIRILLC